MDTLVTNLTTAIVFALLGLGVLGLVLVIVDRLTPYTLWKEIVDEHNTALAVLMGAMAIGISIIIAAAIH